VSRLRETISDDDIATPDGLTLFSATCRKSLRPAAQIVPFGRDHDS
jgi:hypothetical protein